jgi:hypothetical protein
MSYLDVEAADAEKAQALQDIGRSAYESIAEMVAALECDYDRLAKLREMRDDGTDATMFDIEREELAELQSAAGECESREDAEQRIQEDALEVSVRSDWHNPGDKPESPSEFKILLSTGGPATRIIGELNEHGEPTRARLQVQDWGTPWTDYREADEEALLAYARCFYFGEG